MVVGYCLAARDSHQDFDNTRSGLKADEYTLRMLCYLSRLEDLVVVR
jgi:hypothetical protein